MEEFLIDTAPNEQECVYQFKFLKFISDDDDEGDDDPPVKDIPPYPQSETKCQKKNINLTDEKVIQSEVELLLKKSVIGDDFESLKEIPTVTGTKRAQRLQRKKEREKTKGPGWFNMAAPEITEEVKNDLELLKMRSVLDPKRKYKKNDISHTPKYFQVGTVVENAADFYNGRIPKSQRKRTLVEELLADAEARAYQKKKYKSIITDSHRKGHKKHKKKNKQ